MRGIAAMMVVLFHFISFQSSEGFLVESESIRKISTFGAQGVELFFMISGFVIFLSLRRANYSYKNLWQYLKKRIVRIIPLYWLTILLTEAVLFALGKLFWAENVNNSIETIIANAIFIPDLFPSTHWINPVFKTLGVEFLFYIIVGLTFPLLKSKIVRSITFIIIIILSLIPELRETLWYAPYFILGITLLDLKENRNDFVSWNLLTGILSVFAFFYFWDDLLIALIGTICFLFKVPNFTAGNFLGKISYSTYLIHGITGGWFLYFLTQWSGFPNWINIVFAIGFTVFCSWITYYLIENPSTYFSRRIKYKK